MPIDRSGDRGLLSPVTTGTAELIGDAAILDALVAVEIALTRAWAEIGCDAAGSAERIGARLGWRGRGELSVGHGLDVDDLADAAVAGGNPVIPLVATLRALLDDGDRTALHRGATSQDILDSALMLVADRVCTSLLIELDGVETGLAALAREHRDRPTAARTLGQHAVPTTVGLRAATWLVAVRRSRVRLDAARAQLPAQLGGAAGTLAAIVEHARPIYGPDAPSAALRLTEAFALELGLAVPEVPWHTTRWPVTELGDALVQVIDALGVFAADVVTLSRTEIGEVSESSPGGSSAMPQKRNPVASVLVRSAALRAPHLGAALHTAAALAVDERPDGAWHAEWPSFRELLRLGLGAATTARRLAEGLTIDEDAVEKGLRHEGALIVAERLSVVLTEALGAARTAELLTTAHDQDELERLLRAEPALEGVAVARLLDPVEYTGLASSLVDRVLDREDSP